ncbi:CBS domain-containing protein [Acidianus brierleyi]|uniref:CBS domain-containing protein n=2 Tax=Acidianus brierleyi TaxID=41673 RepID=A0A2U9II48_9CREN|nr:CBS domain-containing protein [Acidianus brierleyi]
MKVDEMRVNELLDIKFSDMLKKQTLMIDTNSSIADAASEMIRNNINSLLVAEKGKLVGIVTDKDIVKAVANKLDPSSNIQKIMTRTVITINGDEDVLEVLDTMLNNEIRHLVIRKNGNIVGTITRRDIISYILLFSKEWPSSWR